MSKARPTAKYKRISEILTQSIRDGEYAPGDKLPGIRDLADRFDVHRITIRQATDILVRAGLVSKHERVGMVVCGSDPADVATRRLNLITGASEATNVIQFLEYGISASLNAGFRPRIFRMLDEDEYYASELVKGSDPSIVFQLSSHNSQLGVAVCSAPDRVVLMCSQMDNMGVRSIVADDREGIELAINHLFDHGHSHIALLSSTHEYDQPTLEIQRKYFLEYTSKLMGKASSFSELIHIGHVPVGGPAIAAKRAITKRLRQPHPPTAIIGLSEEVALGARSACYDQGLEVPQDVSLIAYAGGYMAELSCPPLTTIDVNIASHVKTAVEMVNSNYDGRQTTPRVIKPRLIERGSVASISAR